MLSTTAEYALRIMIYLAEYGDEPLTSDRIAEATKVSPDYTIKVLQLLGRANLVHGQRGRRGGFHLDCDPHKTTLLDVVNVIDPLERIKACPLGRDHHRRRLCPLHRRLDDVIRLLHDSLGGMTLRSVIDGSPGPALCQNSRGGITVSVRGSARSKAAARRKKKASAASRTRTRARSR
ncbi:MAG: RrF2 family transcriptional regulator [Planctomycetota bacterium]|jgi:Rrf2 family protein